MPSGKRQLRSASSESRNTSSPLASGTYVRKETPGGLQSKTFSFLSEFDISFLFVLFCNGLCTVRRKCRKGLKIRKDFFSSRAH